MSRAFLAPAHQVGDDCELAAPADGASQVNVIDLLSPPRPQVVTAFTALAPAGPGAAG